jgi:hypothetical protein
MSDTFSTSSVAAEVGISGFPTLKGSGAYGIRTRDLLNAIEALYQLS